MSAITFKCKGQTYFQEWLPSAKAMRLHHKLLRIGFVGAVEVITKVLQGKDITDLSSITDDADTLGSLLAAFHHLLQQTEPEDIEEIFSTLAEVTSVPTMDRAITQPMAAVPDHFADARDMFRYYEFLVKGCMEQCRPFFQDLGTALGDYQSLLSPSNTPAE